MFMLKGVSIRKAAALLANIRLYTNTSLLQTFVNCGRKNLYNVGPSLPTDIEGLEKLKHSLDLRGGHNVFKVAGALTEAYAKNKDFVSWSREY
jgi:hypothetical protein